MFTDECPISSVNMLHKRYGHFSDDTLKRVAGFFDEKGGVHKLSTISSLGNGDIP